MILRLYYVALFALLIGIKNTEATPTHPRIFAYDLPEKWRDQKKYGHEIDAPSCFYAVDKLFPQLLRASQYYTSNASEADYFYVDAWLYWGWVSMDEVIAEIRKFGPFWDRKNGSDHIFAVTADPGRCQYPQDLTRKSIYLTHMGMLQKLETEPCNLFNTWGGNCDPTMKAALGAYHHNLPPGCHIPHQDIVVPPSMYEFDNTSSVPSLVYITPYINDELKGLNRTTKLYYSGKIDLHKDEPDAKERPWSDAHYSFGSRQTVYRMFHSEKGFAIHTSHTHGTYWQDLSSSIFCLASAGWGWGGRLKAAVTRGCIPVIIQDGIKVEFEEQLPLKDYAIRVPTWLVHKLPDILDQYIASGRVEKMQKVLDCAWRLHWWRRPYGRAFEVVMCELKRRLMGVTLTPDRAVDWEKCELHCGGESSALLKLPHDQIVI